MGKEGWCSKEDINQVLLLMNCRYRKHIDVPSHAEVTYMNCAPP